MRIAVVQKGINDEALRNHFVLNSRRLDTFKEVKGELTNVLCTGVALQSGPSPMSVDALNNGKGDKDKGKDSGTCAEKDNRKLDDRKNKGPNCSYRSTMGHTRADCQKKVRDFKQWRLHRAQRGRHGGRGR